MSCTLREEEKPEELEKVLFNKDLFWPEPLGRHGPRNSNPLSTDLRVCTKQGNQIWMSALPLLKHLMKTQGFCVPIFTLHSEDWVADVWLWGWFKNSDWEFGVGELLTPHFPQGGGCRSLSLRVFYSLCLMPLRPYGWVHFLSLCSMFTLGWICSCRLVSTRTLTSWPTLVTSWEEWECWHEKKWAPKFVTAL